MNAKDKAFGEGQKACLEGVQRIANPYSEAAPHGLSFRRLWWAGWDSANRAKAVQNTKAI